MKLFFKRYLWAQCILWTLVPYFTLRVLPLDTLEAIVWGQVFTLGNAKHPPLSGWLAGLMDIITHHSDWGFYLLSQILIIIGLRFIYKIARFFFSPEKAAVAVLLQTFIFYYTITTPEYNVNIISLALWPPFIYYFIKGKHDGKILNWILCGIFGGLNLLNKYTFVLLCAALLIYVIQETIYNKRHNIEKRNFFLTPGPYIAGVIALVIFTPHILWAVREHFPTLTYAGDRMTIGNASFLMRHLLNPLKFLLEATWPILGPALCLIICSRKIKIFAIPETNHGKRANHLAVCVLAGPIIIIFIMAIFGCGFRSMWLSSMYSTAGLLLVSMLKDEPDEKFLKMFRIIICIFFVAWLVAFTCINLCHTSVRRNLPAAKFAAEWEQLYQKEMGGTEPLDYVVGDIWHAGVMHHYAPSHPVGCIYNNPTEMERWDNWLLLNPVLLFSDEPDDITAGLARIGYPADSTKIAEIPYAFSAIFGKERKRNQYYTIITPKTTGD